MMSRPTVQNITIKKIPLKIIYMLNYWYRDYYVVNVACVL